MDTSSVAVLQAAPTNTYDFLIKLAPFIVAFGSASLTAWIYLASRGGPFAEQLFSKLSELLPPIMTSVNELSAGTRSFLGDTEWPLPDDERHTLRAITRTKYAAVIDLRGDAFIFMPENLNVAIDDFLSVYEAIAELRTTKWDSRTKAEQELLRSSQRILLIARQAIGVDSLGRKMLLRIGVGKSK